MEWLFVVLRYYRKSRGWLYIDCLLAQKYLFYSPHRQSRDFLRKRGETNIYAYGETPLTTLHQIAIECRILSKDCVYELGCGPGRSCFWLHHFIGCRVVGIDFLPTFISHAESVKKKAKLSSQVKFIQADMTTIDLKGASVIYLYGTCLEDATIERLIRNLRHVPAETKVITVSYPLTDYCEEGLFRMKHCFQGKFPWGTTEIYLNIKT